MQKIIQIFFTLLIIGACSSDDASKEPMDTSESKIMNDVSYGADTKQVYDIYLPKDRTLSTKVMILVHGGGWNAGDKADMKDFNDYIKEELPDLAVINMNYRLADENNPPHPMQIDDISSVVNDLKAKQSEYQIGTELGFMGVSAGGHLSLLWSYEFDTANQVNMVCSMVGPTNLADDAYINSDNQALQDLIFQFGTDVEVLKEVSPLFKAKTTSPPTILFYGGMDPLIPNSQGVDLNDKLEELEVIHEFTLYPNGQHGWVGLDLFDTSVKLKVFIEKHL